jgi:hypothetical protein
MLAGMRVTTTVRCYAVADTLLKAIAVQDARLRTLCMCVAAPMYVRQRTYHAIITVTRFFPYFLSFSEFIAIERQT